MEIVENANKTPGIHKEIVEKSAKTLGIQEIVKKTKKKLGIHREIVQG